MNYRTLGKTGLKVSELGFGALEIGRNWPYWRKELQDFLRPTESEAIRVLDMAVDLGINFFDTAPAYFKSEEILGKAFKRKRNSVLIATKCGEWFDGERSVYDYSAAETLKFIESSLRLLQTDHIDLLQIHSASPDVVRSGETLAAMKKARKDGKVRFLGISTDQVEAARLAIESGEYDSIQVTYNVLQREFSQEIFLLAEKKKVGVIIKGGLGAGELTSKFTDIAEKKKREQIASLKRLADENETSIQDLALRFTLSHPTVSTVIAGTKNPAHLKSNCESSMRGVLDNSLMEQLSLFLRPE
jgi:aryl-alcohol dehydrogenase-like predicted oxidoreductase